MARIEDEDFILGGQGLAVEFRTEHWSLYRSPLSATDEIPKDRNRGLAWEKRPWAF